MLFAVYHHHENFDDRHFSVHQIVNTDRPIQSPGNIFEHITIYENHGGVYTPLPYVTCQGFDYKAQLSSALGSFLC